MSGFEVAFKVVLRFSQLKFQLKMYNRFVKQQQQQKFMLSVWHIPIIPMTHEADAGESQV